MAIGRAHDPSSQRKLALRRNRWEADFQPIDFQFLNWSYFDNSHCIGLIGLMVAELLATLTFNDLFVEKNLEFELRGLTSDWNFSAGLIFIV